MTTIAGATFALCGTKADKYPYWLKECLSFDANDGTFRTSTTPLYGYYNWTHPTKTKTAFVHKESVFASESSGYLTTTDDGAVKLSPGSDAATPRDQKVSVVLYGGKVSKGGVDWVYDDAVWNEETETYDIQSDIVTIVAAPNATGAVEIPKELNNATVTAIEACAFKNNEGLTCVTVPKTVTRIGVAAFPQGCYIKVKDSPHAQRLVDQLNDWYKTDSDGKLYASIDAGRGFMLIVK